MEPTREILVVGRFGPLPRGPYAVPRVVPLGAVTASFLQNLRSAVLVLGEGALRALTPEYVRRYASFPSCIVLAAPRAGSAEIAGGWTRPGAIEVVEPQRLARRIESAIRVPVRVAVPWQEWVPRTVLTDSLADRAVEILPTMVCLTIERWAELLEVDRRILNRLCAEEFDCSPTDLRWSYVLAVTVRARA